MDARLIARSPKPVRSGYIPFINISQRLLKLQRSQGFTYQILSGEITQKRSSLSAVLVRSTPSQPRIQFYQVSSIYLKGCWSYSEVTKFLLPNIVK